MMRQAAGATTAAEESQRQSWEALRKSINGLINKVRASDTRYPLPSLTMAIRSCSIAPPQVNVGNIKHIVPELFEENLIRGRGLFARAIMKAQVRPPCCAYYGH